MKLKYIYTVTAFVLILFYQNFSIVNLFDKKYFVDEKSRKQHAKEILGVEYKKSSAKKIEGKQFIHVHIYNLVKNALPKKHKSKALNITKAIINEAKKHKIDPVFVASVILTESSFNPDAKGLAGEIGLMQLMPKTGEYIAKKMKHPWSGARTLKDPIKNIRLGTAYLSYLRNKFENKPNRYISAYNSGPGTIKRIEDGEDLPKFYSEKVLKFYENFYKKLAQNKDPNNIAKQM